VRASSPVFDRRLRPVGLLRPQASYAGRSEIAPGLRSSSVSSAACPDEPPTRQINPVAQRVDANRSNRTDRRPATANRT
jgi:hypothetical protein